MNIIASINGRQAVPLRAVPFMDGWNALYPERIVEWLESQPDTPRAFRVDKSGMVTSIEHRFWHSTLKRLEGLVPDDAPRIEWERESVKLIPAEAFMWVDDVLALFRDVGAARVLEHHPVLCLGDEPTCHDARAGRGVQGIFAEDQGQNRQADARAEGRAPQALGGEEVGRASKCAMLLPELNGVHLAKTARVDQVSSAWFTAWFPPF